MTSPCPGHAVSTPWGAEGDWWGCGWHDGTDYAADSGVDVVSSWGGTVVEAGHPTSFGSSFGRAVVVDHDKLPDGSPGGWGLYAHLSSDCVSVGQRVEAGDKLGEVGSTGNSSGPHLHFGVYEQPSWCSGCGVDPQPWIDAEHNDKNDDDDEEYDVRVIWVLPSGIGGVLSGDCFLGIGGAEAAQLRTIGWRDVYVDQSTLDTWARSGINGL